MKWIVFPIEIMSCKQDLQRHLYKKKYQWPQGILTDKLHRIFSSLLWLDQNCYIVGKGEIKTNGQMYWQEVH